MATTETDVKSGDIKAMLKDAAEESSPEETETKETTQKTEAKTESKSDDKSEENRIPQSRFNEVNEALKTAKAQEAAINAKLEEATDKIVKMAALLEERDDDVQTLNQIKAYANDPDMAPHVKAIHNKLLGIEEEVESGETTPEDALKKTRALIDKTREEMAETQASVQAEAMVAKADVIADKLMAQLPEEYNEDDRAVIADLWTDSMDWDEAVSSPDKLSEILTAGFQKVIDRYGTPRGALVSKDQLDELVAAKSKETAEAEANSPEQEIEELLKVDWGATKVVETKDGKQTVPQYSEDEFNEALKKIVRESHNR